MSQRVAQMRARLQTPRHAGSIEAWESGIQWVGPPRLQKRWFPLPRLGHPKRFWELRRLDSNPLQPLGLPDAQTEIALAELLEPAVGFLRFLLAAIWARAKVSRAMRWYPSARFGHTSHRLTSIRVLNTVIVVTAFSAAIPVAPEPWISSTLSVV
jgi:hypothetical protein